MDILAFTGGPFAENTYVILCGDGKSALLVDPGAAAPEALDVIEAKGLEVPAILLTHAHLDHIDGLAEAKRRTDAPVYLHPADRTLFDNAGSQAAMFGVPFEDPPPPDFDLVPGEPLTFGGETFEVLFTPGHAPGHVTFVAKSAPVAIVGDVIFAGSIGRTDLPGGDLKILMESIRTQVLTLPGATRLYPGHGPETTVQHEARTNPYVIPLYGGEFV